MMGRPNVSKRLRGLVSRCGVCGRLVRSEVLHLGGLCGRCALDSLRMRRSP